MRRLTLILFILLACVVLSPKVSSAQDTAAFKPSGHFSSQIFADYYYKVAGDSSKGSKGMYATTPKDGQAFDIRRLYVGYDYDFSRDWSAQLLLAGEGDVLATNGKRAVYIKAANIRWKNLVPMATLVFGQQSTPTFALFTEAIWGYRSIEKTIADFRGLAPSNDAGIALLGKFDEAGTLGYNLMIDNGNGPALENNKFKRYYGSVNGQFLDKKLSVELYGDYEPFSDSTSNTLLKGFASYEIAKAAVLGVEYVMQTQKVGNIADNVTPNGLSLWLRGNITSMWNYFARYDMWDPNSKVDNKGFKESFITAGLDYNPLANIHVMPNIWVDTYKDKSSANLERKADVVARLTFFDKFTY